MNKKLLLLTSLAFALPVSAQQVTELYSDGEHIVLDIPYLEFNTLEGKQAYSAQLISPSDQDLVGFTIDYATVQEVALQQDCVAASDETTEIATAKLYIEHNATDEDTGVHGSFDDHGWASLCVYDPNGKQVLAVNPQEQLKDLTMAGIFFESREPPNDEYNIANLIADFPEGEYTISGVTYDGQQLVGAAIFSHAIPAAPEITYPPLAKDEELAEDDDTYEVSTQALTVSWNLVTATINGDPIDITGYEVIITKEVDDDPHGFSRPMFDVHVPANRTTLDVSAAFLQPGTVYELEVLALEKSGNQTISVGFFKTDGEAEIVVDETYNPILDPENFVSVVDNPYFPLVPGTTRTYRGETEEGLEEIKLTVTHETKQIQGITCTVVRDTVTIDGELHEDTLDWYAQDKDGNVWYMGEFVKNYEEGVFDNNDGSWEAGVDGAKPGIFMYANPKLGTEYRQEYYAGEAEDMGEMLSLTESVEVPYGSFTNVLKTKDWSALEPEVFEYKYYVKGVGTVLEVNPTSGERIELIDISVE